MTPDSAFIWLAPAYFFKWVGFGLGIVALLGLLTLVHALCIAGKQTDEEMHEDDL